MLAQDRDTLVFDLHTKPDKSATARRSQLVRKIPPGRLQHVLCTTYAAGDLQCYLDGKAIPISGKIQGDFSPWSEQQLVFGDEYSGKFNWFGRLEAIAIFNRGVASATKLPGTTNYSPGG